jgi:hypothetical protein
MWKCETCFYYYNERCPFHVLSWFDVLQSLLFFVRAICDNCETPRTGAVLIDELFEKYAEPTSSSNTLLCFCYSCMLMYT